MDCSVVVEAAVPVYDVGNTDEAIRIAISKTGEMLNPNLSYVEINVRDRPCPDCGTPHDPAFVAADEGLVALELEMVVFNVEREEHASRIARKEIGQRLRDIPLTVLSVEVVEDEDAEAADGVEPDEVAVSGEEGEDGDDELLPDFEELIE
ncbi:MAG: DUF555 domain-containing protein [Halobacteriales archaeon]|nr:DUF555 domain-containing protein [Halobacteriales archaeon]